MKKITNLTVMVISLLALTKVMMFSSCIIEEDLEQLGKALSGMGNYTYQDPAWNFPAVPPRPFLRVDSISYDTLDSYRLWMSAQFIADTTFIFKNFSVNYWEADAQAPETFTKLFEVVGDTVDFSVMPQYGYSFSAMFDSLKAGTSYMFCLADREYALINSLQTGSIPGSCNTVQTK